MSRLSTSLSAFPSFLRRFPWVLLLVALPNISCGQGTEPTPHADIQLITDFEGASLGWQTQVGPREFYISIRHDTYSGYLRWYSFRVEGGQGVELTFRITNANETSSDSAWFFDRPLASADGGETWGRISDTEYEGPTGRFFTFRYTPQTNSDWIAYAPVYNLSRWQNLVEELRGSPRLDTLEVVAESVQGNPIHLLKVTDPSVPDSLKTAIWVVARQHAADAGSSWMAEGLLRWLLGQDSDATRLSGVCSVYLIPFMNPDGVLRGNYIANGLGLNLNRQWAAPDSLTTPSVFAVSKLMHTFFASGGSAQMFVDLQNQAVARANFIFFNGADVTSPEMATEIEDFAQVLSGINPDIFAEASEAWTGDTTVASRWAYDSFGIHGIMLEGSFQDVGYGAHQGEYMTVDRYLAIGEALGEGLAEFFFPVNNPDRGGSPASSDRH